ncbi:DUF1064 domain-containing protein [Paraburkholderia sediminicola]|uniref:DUF1064 domain-containing protein n=1 Tax=Paraburkholderia sediminicola TaxID=458836 RepID=UPI0038B6E279
MRIGISRTQMRKPSRRRMTEAEYAALVTRSNGTQAAPVAARASKYGNEKAMHEGMKFDSKRELRKWLSLLDQQAAGVISGLQRQVPFVLAESVDLGEKRRKPAMRYFADYVYTIVATGERVVGDAKGKKTPDYRMKKHLMASVHGIVIQEF